PGAPTRQQNRWGCRLARCNGGAGAGSPEIFPSRMNQDAAASRFFPPLDRARVQAMACETVAQTKLPLSRQSIADLARRAKEALGRDISSSSVWRMLHESAIKPWQHEHWIFPRDPAFEAKASPVLDLYAGIW